MHIEIEEENGKISIRFESAGVEKCFEELEFSEKIKALRLIKKVYLRYFQFKSIKYE